MKLSIHAGAVSPYFLEVTIGSDAEGFDLTLVTGGVFEILRDSKKLDEPEEWAADLSAAIETSAGTQCTLTHLYEAGDVPDVGTLSVRAKLEHPDGSIYSRSFPLHVTRGF